MSNINPDPFTTRPEIEGTFGVVTSTHWIATAVGMALAERLMNARFGDDLVDQPLHSGGMRHIQLHRPCGARPTGQRVRHPLRRG